MNAISYVSGWLNNTVVRKLYCCMADMARPRIVKIDTDRLHEDLSAHVALASKSLLAGHVIAVPTDTIYGIAGLAQNTNAVSEIYNIKNRDYSKPVAISVGNIEDIYRWSKVTVSKELLSDLLPGPVTVVMERTKELNPDLNPNTKLVGVRIPDHNFIRAIAQACRGPLALTSANVSSLQSTLSVQEFSDLWSKLDLIFDGGVLGKDSMSRLGSTVVDLSVPEKFRIIREGSAYLDTTRILKDKYKLEEILRIL